MNQILQKLAVDFKFYTGATFSGIAESLCLGFASRLSEFDSKTDFIERQAFIETANREYLFLHAGHLLQIKPSQFAKGSVVFFGEKDAKIPVGTIVKDASSEYVTTAEGVLTKLSFVRVAKVDNGVVTLPPILDLPSCECLAAGIVVSAISTPKEFVFAANGIRDGEITIDVIATAPVLVEALSPGVDANLGLSATLQTKSKLDGVDQSLGAVSIAGGKEIENVEDYRKRVKYFLANPQAPFSEENIKQTILSAIPTISDVWIIGGNVTPGSVEVFVTGRLFISDTSRVSTADKASTLALIQELRPVNLPVSRITVSEPVYVKSEVKISNLVPSTPGLTLAIDKNLATLFLDSRLFNKALSVDSIKSAIYRSFSNSEIVQSFTLDSSGVVAHPKTLSILDKVTYS